MKIMDVEAWEGIENIVPDIAGVVGDRTQDRAHVDGVSDNVNLGGDFRGPNNGRFNGFGNAWIVHPYKWHSKGIYESL